MLDDIKMLLQASYDQAKQIAEEEDWLIDIRKTTDAQSEMQILNLLEIHIQAEAYSLFKNALERFEYRMKGYTKEDLE